MYLLPIAGTELILGASWLATLGPHVADYSTLTIKFYLGGQFITLHGDKPKLPAMATQYHIKRMQVTTAISEMFTIQLQQPHTTIDQLTDLTMDIESELALLLHTYRQVFDKPTGLQPDRAHNHSIPLIEGSTQLRSSPIGTPTAKRNKLSTWFLICWRKVLQDQLPAPSLLLFYWSRKKMAHGGFAPIIEH